MAHRSLLKKKVLALLHYASQWIGKGHSNYEEFIVLLIKYKFAVLTLRFKIIIATVFVMFYLFYRRLLQDTADTGN